MEMKEETAELIALGVVACLWFAFFLSTMNPSGKTFPGRLSSSLNWVPAFAGTTSIKVL
jgi:hypothetical protein